MEPSSKKEKDVLLEIKGNEKEKEIEEEDLDKQVVDKIKALPNALKYNAIGLQTLCQEKRALEARHGEELKELTMKYEAKFSEIFKKCNEIISAERNPSANELDSMKSLFGGYEEKKEATQEFAPIDSYWLKALQSHDGLSKEITEKDADALKYLTKIDYLMLENGQDFQLEFHFAPNEFFENKILQKKFTMLNDDKPEQSEGTAIEWKKGKDLTKKKVTKKQRNKKSGEVRTVVKDIDSESFFNFFQDVNPKNEKEEEDVIALEEKLDKHLENADMVIKELLPFSLGYQLGVKMAAEDDFEEEDDVEDEEPEENLNEKEELKEGSKKTTKKQGKQKDDEETEELITEKKEPQVLIEMKNVKEEGKKKKECKQQ